MKTAISIPDRLFKAAERAAKRRKMSRSRFYSQALAAYLRASQDEEIKRQLNAVYATEDSSLDPVIASMQSIAIGREDW
ncbi:MAG: ChpI protein [Acidobacteriia bacterium]|nr:ChpI protein [Terriglobia bacterium]